MSRKKYLLSIVLLFSTNSFAIVGGQPIALNTHSSIIHSRHCSGTILAGKWMLTAEHCSTPKNPNDYVTDSLNNKKIQVSQQINYRDWQTDSTNVDAALWQLPTPIAVNQISIISPITIKSGDYLSIFGFGNTGNELRKAVHRIVSNPKIINSSLESCSEIVSADVYDKGATIGGDSGAPYFDNDNHLVAIHRGHIDDYSIGTKVSAFKDFILDTINGWNYPTQVNNVTENKTITVQSLHSDDVVDQSTTTGDVYIDSLTCDKEKENELISPYAVCTYVISSGKDGGRLILSPTEHIIINGDKTNTGSTEKKKPIQPSTPPTSSKSGGSLNFLSLFLLALFGFKRWKLIK